MKKRSITLITILGVVFLAAFTLQSQMPGPDADEFWTYITKTSPYTEWKFWEDHEGMQPGNAPHGPFHKVFVNDILLNAESTPVPYGSILVKESYNNNKKMTAITVMYKIKDFNPEAGDWYWARFSSEGKGGPDGKVNMCIGCHSASAENDYMLVHEIK